MPLSAVTQVLAAGFLPMFKKETSPPTTADAGRQWAMAYVTYCLAGGVLVTPDRIAGLIQDIIVAFNPALPGTGPSLLFAAFAKFWPGLLVPYMTPGAAAVSFIPTGSANSPEPPTANAEKQANDLAEVIAGLTLAGVQVLLPTGPPLVPIT